MSARFPQGWRRDPAVMAVVREHGRREHTVPRLDCPVCRRFWPRAASVLANPQEPGYHKPPGVKLWDGQTEELE